MAIASAKKIEILSQAVDPKIAIISAIGDLSNQQVFSDLVLVGTYVKPEKQRGVILPQEHVQESEWQSKVGLVLKVGPLAYAEWESEDERGQNAKVGTWVVYDIKEGVLLQINETPCRLIPYERIRMRVTDPTLVY